MSFLDLVAVVSLGYALWILIQTPQTRRPLSYYSLLFLVMVYFSNSLPNFIEWVGFQGAVEPFEIYVQILVPAGFMIFFGFVVYKDTRGGLSTRKRVLGALHVFSEGMPTGKDPDEVWREILGRAIGAMGLDGGFVKFSGDNGLIKVRMDWEGAEEFGPHLENIDMENTLLGEIFKTGKPVIVAQTRNVPDSLIQTLRLCGVSSVALFPVHSEKRVLGAMGVVSRAPRRFSRIEGDLFTMLGHHLGEIILNSVLLREARDQTREFQSALAAQKRFLQVVTEGLRGPVSRIRGAVSRMEDGGAAVSGRIEEVVRLVGEDTERLEKILCDVREFSDLEEGARNLKVVPIDLRRELFNLAEAFLNEARRKGIRLVVDLKDEYAPVEADRELLRNALRHLVSNSIKYTPHGGSVRLFVEEESERARIRVHDTGIGIPPEDAEHVFERFFRTKAARDQEKTGTGLGLAIVRRIARMHGGEIDFTSVPGKETTFTLTLPRLQIR